MERPDGRIFKLQPNQTQKVDIDTVGFECLAQSPSRLDPEPE